MGQRVMVIKAPNIEQVREIFEALFSVTFVEEQHGDGPRHYAVQVGDNVLEIYPGQNRHWSILTYESHEDASS